MTTIIICEKPDACMRISKSLSNGKFLVKESTYGVKYYEFKRGREKFISVAAVGHLFNLKQKGKGWYYPMFDLEWIPSFKARAISAFSEKYYRTIEEVVSKHKNAKFISAADYDNEGSLIAYNILRFICNTNNAKRMKFSTLAKPDLIKSYETMEKKIDWQNIEAGLARHFLDYYYGINTSRALTLAIKKHAKRFSLLTAGRVQGPTLVMLAEKEKKISKFKPKPYWELKMGLMVGKNKITAEYENKKITNKKLAEKIFKECKKSKVAVIESVVKKKYKQSPPVPFNITSLQTDAYRYFGYSPRQTMQIAQKLYSSAYLSYPRTSSEKIPGSIDPVSILKALGKIKMYKKLVDKILAMKEIIPNEGKRIDPAHEAIHPTVEVSSRLGSSNKKIYDLVCRRFLAIFAGPAMRESMKVTIRIGKHKFVTTGRRTIEKGWMEYYGPYAKHEEVIFPELKKGDKLKIKGLEKLSKETSPPPRYSQASIIKEMDKRGLGTRATRAGILETLYNRDYVVDRSIKVTELGMKIAAAIEKYVPDFADEKLTKRFEKDLEKIQAGKLKKETVLRRAKTAVIKISNEFKKAEDKIGKGLSEAIVKTQEEKITLGKCLDCGGELKILYSPWSKKKFVGCSNYNRCKKCGFTKKACKCNLERYVLSVVLQC